jgi:anti-sigma-K factor RskA
MISRLHIRSDAGGWAISFGRSDFDAAAFKQDILTAAEKRNQESRIALIREMRSEIERSQTNLTQQQQVQLTATLARLDSRITGRIATSEGRVKDDTQKLVSDLYRVIAQQRAQDLEAINLRLDSTDANNAIKTRQTNEILGTLLQVADLKLR